MFCIFYNKYVHFVATADGTEPVLWKPTLHQRYVLKDFTTLPQRPGHGLLVPVDERNKVKLMKTPKTTKTLEFWSKLAIFTLKHRNFTQVWLMSTVAKLVRTEPDR